MKTASALLLVACLLTPAAADPAADPARALCLKNGATVTTEALPNGTEHAVCMFPDGSRLDAAAYFRNKHRTR